MSRQLTVMFCPINFVGPMNASIGMAEVVRDSGHRIVFAIKSEWTGKLKIHGFEEEIIGNNEDSDGKGSAEKNATEFKVLFGPKSRVEKLKDLNKTVVDIQMKDIEKDEPFLEEIVKRVKPDVILVDNVFYIPSLMASGIPWVWVMSCNPLTFQYGLDDEKLPPKLLGISH